MPISQNNSSYLCRYLISKMYLANATQLTKTMGTMCLGIINNRSNGHKDELYGLK